MCNLCNSFGNPIIVVDYVFLISSWITNTVIHCNIEKGSHCHQKVLLINLKIIIEDDVIQERRWEREEKNLTQQEQNSWELAIITKKYYSSDDGSFTSNNIQNPTNHMPITYELNSFSTMKYIRGIVSKFDTISFHKFIDESCFFLYTHLGNMEEIFNPLSASLGEGLDSRCCHMILDSSFEANS